MDDGWNVEEANRLVSNSLVEIDALAEQIFPLARRRSSTNLSGIKDGFLLKSITVVSAIWRLLGARAARRAWRRRYGRSPLGRIAGPA
jgi:hypothetical protein